jgi:hypothetical protein
MEEPVTERVMVLQTRLGEFSDDTHCMTKIPCEACGVPILPDTAARNDGKCNPCCTGSRALIEASRARREAGRTNPVADPLRELWVDLVRRVHGTPDGFDTLSKIEKLYFAVGMLEGEVYNGGFEQYFSSSSGNYYRYAVEGLEEMGALKSLTLLQKARQVVFGFDEPDGDPDRRRARLSADQSRSRRLEALDPMFWEDPDVIEARMRQFAIDHGLACVA